MRATKRSARKNTGKSKKTTIKVILRHAGERLLENSKPSVAELVRLLELRRELKKSEPRKLTVKWIDRCAEPGSEE